MQQQLNVYWQQTASTSQAVGKLIWHQRQIYFEYDPKFLTLNIELSPFKLPLQPGLQQTALEPFSGLWGIFADSLPDGWGLLLMDRYLRTQGYDTRALTPLDRLAYMGPNAMGALFYEPRFEGAHHLVQQQMIDIHFLAQEATEVYLGEKKEVVEQLLTAGGSPAGARPKALIAQLDHHYLITGANIPKGYEPWLIKFHTGYQPLQQQEGLLEEAYARLSRLCGINMPETQIIHTNSQHYFAIKRFDWHQGQRLHMHTLAGLIHANYRMPDTDYEHLLRVTQKLTQKQSDVEEAFRRMLFNIIFVNRDDHTKNFSFLMSSKGEWSLSPAYDLTFSYGPGGEHTLSVAGMGKAITKKAIMQLGQVVGLSPKIQMNILNQVLDVTQKWEEIAQSLSISNDMIRLIRKAINEATNNLK